MKGINRFKIERTIQKLTDHMYATDYLTNMILDNHRDDFFATKDWFKKYAAQNNETLKSLTILIKTMVEVDIKSQNEIFELKARVEVLEKK